MGDSAIFHAGCNPLHVPGVLRCARCNYVLTRSKLCPRNGTIGPGTSETEPCPNGCGPLWPMTWEQWAREAVATSERFLEEAQSLREAVKLAYGHLWHVNLQPMAPVAVPSCETAAIAARGVLRNALTSNERRDGIDQVRKLLNDSREDAGS